MIEYNEKVNNVEKSKINPIIINDYFKSIFQADHLAKNPTSYRKCTRRG